MTVKTITLFAAAAAILFLAPPFAFSEAPVFSGVSESASYAARGSTDRAYWEIEQFANLRAEVEAGEKGMFYAAVNAKAVSGNDSEPETGAEVERLYVSVWGDSSDLYAGYMRIAFGFGQAFRPTDILNPPNPLYPEARPEGALGVLWALYPSDTLKFQLFGADRNNPWEQYPGYSCPLGGFAGEIHTPDFSAQLLYALQASPEDGGESLINNIGFSLKFDAVLGFVLDMLYRAGSGGGNDIDNLEFTFGADYSLLDGDLYLLAQYYFNGQGFLESGDSISELYGTDDWADSAAEDRIPIAGYSDYYRKHYLFVSSLYSFSDYTRFGLDTLFSIEDLSLLPALRAEHEPFQGMTLSVTARIPLDSHILAGGERGELGPDHTGYDASLRTVMKLRF